MAEGDTQQESSEGIELTGNKIIWIVGAIVLVVAGYFGLKAIFASMENFRLTLIDAPKEVNASSTATFTWRIDGPATTTNHTAVHLGTTSQPGELGSDVKPENTSYNLLVQDFASGNFAIPLQFVGNIFLDTSGTYYYRVHALIKDKHYWTDEYNLEVKPLDLSYKVTLLDAPPEVTVDQLFALTWRVDGMPTTINHTSIHYGTVSTPGELGKDIKPEDTKYTDLVKDFAQGNFNIPLQFVGNTTIAKAGTYYYRGHAIINNENYWTEERTLIVKVSQPTVTVAVPETPIVTESR